MNLFRRLIFGGGEEQLPPTVGEIRNELDKTQIITLYAYDQLSTFNYGFIDVRRANFPDSVSSPSSKGMELYVNNQYIDTFYFSAPENMYIRKQVFLGSTKFNVRVFDELGQFSPMSNTIEYYVLPHNSLTDTSYIEDATIGTTGKDVHLQIWKWLDTVHLNVINLLDIFVDFEIVIPGGVTLDPAAIFTAEIHGNSALPTILTLDSSDNWGGSSHKKTLNMGKVNPNEYDKWRISGLLGIKLRKENAPAGVQLKAIWRLKDANNLESTWIYYF